MASSKQPPGLAVHLSQYLVPPDQLEFGEYLFEIKPTDDVSRRHFHQLITALLNTSGGIIIIDLEVSLESKACDNWRNSLRDQLLKFMPQAVYTDCIQLHEHRGFLLMVVHKSEQFITTESFLFTRGPGAETIAAKYHRDITQIQCQEVVRGDAIIFPRTGQVTYMGICPYSESKNLEFKCYTCKTMDDLFKRLDRNRATETMLAMANLSGGGEIILGVREQSSQKVYIGQEVPDQQKFVQKLTEYLQMDSSGSSRVWGELTEMPVNGIHWSCDFIPLSPPPYNCQPSCQFCPHTKQRHVVCISVFQYPGGVFQKRPESFTVADNGEVIEMSFGDWKDKHRQHAEIKITSQPPPAVSPSVPPQVMSPTVPTQAVSLPVSSQAVSPRVAPPPLQGTTPLPQAQTIPEAQEHTGVFEDEMTISFKKHSSRVQLREKGEKYTTEHMKNIGIFEPTSPVHCTPSNDEIEEYVFKKTRKILPDVIHEDLSKQKGFGIAYETLYSCLNHDVKSLSSIASDTSQRQTLSLKPTNHILDLLVLTNIPKIFLFVVCATFGTELRHLVAYTMVLSRVIKKKILQHTKQTDQIKSLNVLCKIVSLDGTNPQISPDYYHRWFSKPHTGSFADLSSLLARILSQVKTQFRDDIYLAADFKASLEQTDTLLAIQNSRFNIVEGPPGCGKTLLARHVCETHGRENSAYISACVALNARVGASGEVDVFYASDSSHILSLLQGELKDKTYIVIDDNHNYTYTDKIAQDLCETVARKGMTMYIFQDSQYQNYKDQIAPQDLQQALCAGKYGSYFIKALTEIRRNSQVVGSFLTAQISRARLSPYGNDFKCVGAVNGDDIMIKHIANLRERTEKNGLLHHVKSLLTIPLSTRAERCIITDIAVLVDDPKHKRAKNDVRNFHKLFQEFWPESKVHRAAVYPVEGVIIDTLSNFSGLESKVVVFVMPRSSDDRPEAASSKHRIAVASRGILRVDFLRQDNLDEELAGSMACDRCPPNAMKPISKLYNEDTTKSNGPDPPYDIRSGKMSCQSHPPRELRAEEEINSMAVALAPPRELRVKEEITSMAVTAAGDILCCSGDSVLMYSADGARSEFYGPLSEPRTPSDPRSQPRTLRPHSLAALEPSGDLVVGYVTSTKPAVFLGTQPRPVYLTVFSRGSNTWSPLHSLGAGDWPSVAWTQAGRVAVGVWDTLILYDPTRHTEVWRRTVGVGIHAVAVCGERICCCLPLANSISVYGQDGALSHTFELQPPGRQFSWPLSVCEGGGGQLLVLQREEVDGRETGLVTAWTGAGQYVRDVVTGLPGPSHLDCLRSHGATLYVSVPRERRIICYRLRPESSPAVAAP